jgi:hypothetical protein
MLVHRVCGDGVGAAEAPEPNLIFAARSVVAPTHMTGNFS